MTALVNLGAVLVFALLVFAAVGAAFRFVLPAEPHQGREAEPRRVRWRRMAADIVGVVALLALLDAALEVRAAFGSPLGDRDGFTVEVVEVGECERAPLGFGIARRCALTAYRSDSPPGAGSIEVVTGGPLRPGELVARYASSGWTAWLFLGSSEPRWFPVSAEDRPNLDWVPVAVLVGASVGIGALRRMAVGRARNGRDPAGGLSR
jgi:hypothetical protein